MNTLTPLRALPSLADTSLAGRPMVRIAGTPGTPRPSELRELGPSSAPATRTASGATGATESSFSGLLGRMVTEVNAKQQAAGQAVADLQSGKPVALHQAMISMEEASVSFQLMAEVRNKLLESYQELMRMQV